MIIKEYCCTINSSFSNIVKNLLHVNGQLCLNCSKIVVILFYQSFFNHKSSYIQWAQIVPSIHWIQILFPSHEGISLHFQLNKNGFARKEAEFFEALVLVKIGQNSSREIGDDLVRLKRKAFANHELNDCLKSWNSMNDKIQSSAKKQQEQSIPSQFKQENEVNQLKSKSASQILRHMTI